MKMPFRRREDEYTTHLNDSNDSPIELKPVTTCDYDRKFDSLRCLRIHKAHWCRQCNSPMDEYKLNDGIMYPNYKHCQDAIAECQNPGEKPSIQ